MVGDREVVGILFRKLLDPDYRDGAILDGFPRTEVQVECLKLLVDKMKELRARFFETPLRVHFRQPTIHIMVLSWMKRPVWKGRSNVDIKLRRTIREVLQWCWGMCGVASHRPGPQGGPTKVSGVQGADLGGTPVTQTDFLLPFRQRTRLGGRSGAQHS